MALERSIAPQQRDFLDREDILDMIRQAWVKRNPGFTPSKKKRKERNRLLIKRLRDLQTADAPMQTSEQISLEAAWLINHTDNWTKVDAKLDQLEASLAITQPKELVQQSDGGWGPGYEEWYMKLEPTVDALQDADIKPKTLKPLTFMARLQDPKWLMNYLYRLQFSDIIQTGRNNRGELGAVQSALSQLIFKDDLRQLLETKSLRFTVSDELQTGYADYLRQTQHPRTGYWGAWYRFDDKLYATHDLSFTFHVIHYLSGNVDNWPQIIESTFEMKELVYPYGWKPDENTDYNNHNNYDVVTILSHGWSHMTMRQRETARLEIAKMWKWCLGTSVKEDGFVTNDGEEIDAYYYGLRFLDLAGFFEPAKRFWSRAAPPSDGLPTPSDLAVRLERGFTKFADHSEESDTVRTILNRAKCLNPTPVIAGRIDP